MGKSNNPFNINGRIGNLVYYKVGDKWYVRMAKGKMSDAQKQAESFRASMQTLETSDRGAAFGELLFKGFSTKKSCDPKWYPRMKGYMHGIVKMDKVSDRGNQVIQPENVHHISGLVANTLFPEPMRKGLESTSFQKKDKKLLAKIPALSNPLSRSEVSHWSVWIELRAMIPGAKDYRWIKTIETVPEPLESIKKTEFSFDFPHLETNEHLIAVIGFWSYKDGIRCMDRRFNGVVFQEVLVA